MVPLLHKSLLHKSQKFRVRVWGSYTTYRSSGYGYGSVTELTEVLGIVARAHKTHSGMVGMNMPCRTPGIVAQVYITHRSSGYGYERHTKLPEVPSTDMNALQNLQKFFEGYYPR